MAYCECNNPMVFTNIFSGKKECALCMLELKPSDQEVGNYDR